MSFEMTKEQLAYLVIVLIVLVIRKLCQWSDNAWKQQVEEETQLLLAALADGQKHHRLEQPKCCCHAGFEVVDLEAGLQAHVLVCEVLDGIPGFDEYFNRTRKRR